MDETAKALFEIVLSKKPTINERKPVKIFLAFIWVTRTPAPICGQKINNRTTNTEQNIWSHRRRKKLFSTFSGWTFGRAFGGRLLDLCGRFWGRRERPFAW